MQLTNHLNGTPTPADTTNGAAPPPGKKPAPGRDANGRFTKGNLGGLGNPFARQVAGFRRALRASFSLVGDLAPRPSRLRYEPT